MTLYIYTKRFILNNLLLFEVSSLKHAINMICFMIFCNFTFFKTFKAWPYVRLVKIKGWDLKVNMTLLNQHFTV
jgi:hypothetical protein